MIVIRVWLLSDEISVFVQKWIYSRTWNTEVQSGPTNNKFATAVSSCWQNLHTQAVLSCQACTAELMRTGKCLEWSISGQWGLISKILQQSDRKQAAVSSKDTSKRKKTKCELFRELNPHPSLPSSTAFTSQKWETPTLASDSLTYSAVYCRHPTH